MGAQGSAVEFVMKSPDHILAEGRTWGAKGSAVEFVMKAPDYIQAEGRTWVQKVQQWSL
jgi:hypothetical protein